MKVIARKDSKCPKEGTPREYIGDDIAQEVPETTYYLRLIEDGSLLRADDSQKKKGGN